MRKIFLIALFALCAIEGFSQRYTPFQGWGFSARRLKADSVSIVPSDTVINKAPNSVAIFNGRVYFQNGTRWQDISYDLPINVRDSISALYPLLYNSSTGVLSADTGRNAINLATAGLVDKVKDSLAASIVLRLLISDTASMLSPYLRKVDTASISNRIDLKLNISDTASMLLSYRNTLNAVQVNKLNISDTASMLNNYRNTLNTVQVNKLNLSDSSLYASRGRLYKVADSLGSVISSVSADSLVFSTKAYRQKGVDSVQANLTAGLALKLNISDTSSMLSPYYRTALANATIVQRITDSLRSLVRLRASGSGGIDVQNSSGTSVANFGSGGSTNISLNGSTNVNARLSVTDSIVGNSFRFIGGGNIARRLSINTSDTSRSLVVGGDISAVTGVYSGNLSSSLGANFATSSGNVGIGTVSPAAKFHVYAAAAGGMELTPGATTQFEFIDRNNTSNTVNTEFYTRNGYFSFNTGQYTERLRIRNDGTSSFNSTLSVSGALTATAQGNNITVGVDSSVTSTSYTLVLGDAGYLKRCSNASAITITVPTNASVAFPIGTTIYFSQQGAGKVSVSPATSDVTIQSEGSLLGTAGQHAVIGLIKVNTNRWLLVGNRG